MIPRSRSDHDRSLPCLRYAEESGVQHADPKLPQRHRSVRPPLPSLSLPVSPQRVAKIKEQLRVLSPSKGVDCILNDVLEREALLVVAIGESLQTAVLIELKRRGEASHAAAGPLAHEIPPFCAKEIHLLRRMIERRASSNTPLSHFV